METKTKMNQSAIQTDKPEIFALLKRTNKENPTAADLAELRETLRDNPQIWQNVGDLSRGIENRLLPDNALTAECLKVKLEQMRDELGWQNSSELEKLLIEQICLTWLRLHALEGVHLSKTSESHSLNEGTYYDKRLSEAQKRFLRATETLAKVRKMLAQTQAAGAKMYKNLVQAEKNLES